ncbi:hypothetical protein BASA62_004353 [Batrachochytrium salamandrivorans]|nr:hypothetical protein BASA62_004353 [Batrachochytrium salamandrivorans]
MQTQKATTGKANPLPVVLSLTVSARMRSICSCDTKKGSRCQPTTPGRSVGGSERNLSQQVAAQQAEMDALRNTIALQQKATANLEKILSNMASQMSVNHPLRTLDFADAVKRRPTHQQLVERQPEFRKAGAAAWLALKRETSVPAHSAPKVELSSGLRLIYASGFPYAKPGDLRKAMQGARIRTSAPGIPRSEAADKDKLAAISSFAAKTVTTIQRSPDVKARNFFRSLLASIGGKTLEAATAEATKIRVQTPGFSISTLETVPKESLPVKKATDKEPAAPAVDPPSDMAAEVTPAIQDDGVTPTVTPIADVEMCL